MSIIVSNNEFLSTLFGSDAPWVHVTDFSYDPGNIPEGRHLAAWAGGYFSQKTLTPGFNQYFTISCFYADEQGKARRRKALYRHTPVIVLDDVREKLSIDEARKLPKPTWILETSPGSEQWGYRLDVPCTDRFRVENLLDGLVANGLAPEGKDPGMKGVTRYVRLPEGSNTKANKMVNGQPYPSTMLEWHPERSVTIEQLALPFAVNLDAPRREQRIDGASDIPDHPLLGVADTIHIKEVRSAGRFDITCPWVDEHTGAVDNGAAVFTNEDGSIGFKCHHGACQSRTGHDLLNLISNTDPGFRETLATWKLFRAFEAVAPAPVSFIGEETPVPSVIETPEVSFLGGEPQIQAEVPPAPEQGPPAAPTSTVAAPSALQAYTDQLRLLHPTSAQARELATQLLKAADELSVIDQIQWHDTVKDIMGWTKSDLTKVIKGLRQEWYSGTDSVKEFYRDVMFVKELNQFFNWRTRTFLSVEGFQNANAHEDADARKGALQDGHAIKVDKLDYLPGSPRVFVERGITYGNMYFGDEHLTGVEGDATPWLNHWDALGWQGHKKHMLQWMAFTLRHPEQKINHMLILGSREGCGKDFLLYPLLEAMGNDAIVIDGDALAEPYNGYLIGAKYLHINEMEMGDHREANAIANKLKPIAAAPPDRIRIREMFTKPFWMRNLINGTMTTNSNLPVRLKESRRYYPVWSDLQTKEDGETTPEWQHYWSTMWTWMKNGGAQACIHYLMNSVDLSDFKPGAPPPVTDFLRQIQEDSKPPLVKTLEDFISLRIGVFDSDLLTINDMLGTLRLGEVLAPEAMHCEAKSVATNRISTALRDIGAYQVRATKGRDTKRIWAIRDVARYKSYAPVDVFTEYERQINPARAAQPLHVVG